MKEKTHIWLSWWVDCGFLESTPMIKNDHFLETIVHINHAKNQVIEYQLQCFWNVFILKRDDCNNVNHIFFLPLMRSNINRLVVDEPNFWRDGCSQQLLKIERFLIIWAKKGSQLIINKYATSYINSMMKRMIR